jgi:hypothetical protein
MLITNAAFLFGYYLLPEGSLRQGPQTAAASVAASADTFGAELVLTLLFNVGVVLTVAVVMNLNRVRASASMSTEVGGGGAVSGR